MYASLLLICWNNSLQITYSVPYAMICSRVESLQLGQGGDWIDVAFFE